MWDLQMVKGSVEFKEPKNLGPLVQSLVKGMVANRSGVSVLRVPMGSNDYINTFLADKVERFVADFPALKLTDFKVYLNLVRPP